VTEVPCSQWQELAEAVVYVYKNGGLEGIVAVLLGIAFWRKPWFRDQAKP